jgi:hypothetical protein
MSRWPPRIIAKLSAWWKNAAAGQQRHGLLAGVDEVVVFLALGGRGAHAQDAVLALQDDLDAGRQVVGHQRGHADAEVDVGAVEHVARDALGQLVLGAYALTPV